MDSIELLASDLPCPAINTRSSAAGSAKTWRRSRSIVSSIVQFYTDLSSIITFTPIRDQSRDSRNSFANGYVV